MSFGFSAGDFLAAAGLAWSIYTQLRNAPAEIQAISDDVGLLHVTLRSMNENVINSAPLSVSDIEGIGMTMERCRNVLAELQPLADKYGKKPFSFRNRVKLQMEDIAAIRERLRMALGGLNSFNSAVSLSLSLKIDTSQESILRALIRIQADVQAGKREGSTISQAAQDPEKADEADILEEVLRELEREGVSKEEIRENKSVITRWIMKGVRDGQWLEFQPDTPPSYFTLPIRTNNDDQITLTHRCKIEVLSATYGPMDVTNKMRQFLMSNVLPTTKTRVFVPSNEFFGRDPYVAEFKLFVLVWRKRLSWDRDSRQKYTQPRTLIVRENQQAIFDYEWDAPPMDLDLYSASNLNIISATFSTEDVTCLIGRLIRDPIRVSDAVLGDPQVGVRKTLTVTYSYGIPDNIADCYVKTCLEHTDLYIPPPLKIAAANFATTDITDTLRAQVTPDQRLVVDLRHQLCYPDPFVNQSKTVAIIFQYGDEPLQLIVRWEINDFLRIESSGPQQRNFLNPIPPREDDAIHILGAVWGVKPIYLRHFGLMQQRKEFPCTNEWFGFDGRPNVKKTCQVFVQDARNGKIRCIAAREGETLKIAGDKWDPISLPPYSELPGENELSTSLVDATLSDEAVDLSEDSGGKSN